MKEIKNLHDDLDIVVFVKLITVLCCIPNDIHKKPIAYKYTTQPLARYQLMLTLLKNIA